MNKYLENILQCPITKSSLRKMEINEIKKINIRISKNNLWYYDGTLIKKNIKSGFISLNGQYIYIVEDGIIALLPYLAIALNKDKTNKNYKGCFKKEKRIVQNFYEEVGWEKRGKGLFVDALKSEDLRPVAKDYIHKCHLRINRYLKSKGEYILDVASGPIQYPEYLTYSSNFNARICIDFSILALKEAKKKLGDKGIYILGDITNLPLKNNSIDAIVSLHTILHVSKEEQKKAFQEIYRLLRQDSSAVIVYSWGTHSPLMTVTLFPFQMIRIILKSLLTKRFIAKILEKKVKLHGLRLYSHTYSYRWFLKQKWEFNFDILVWRSVNTRFLKIYIHNWLFGKQILRFIYWLEEKIPHLAGRFGQYPIVVIKK